MTEISGVPSAYYVPSMPSVEEENEIPMSREDSQTTESVKLPEDKKIFTELEEVSLTFNRGESYDYIGKDSSLDNLDIRKAISDMRKDKILEEYQYFVGGKPDLEYDDDIDGVVFLK